MKSYFVALLLIGLVLAVNAASQRRYYRQTSNNEVVRQRENCIARCLATSEYNPVCGTNGETYMNIGKMNCAKGCGTTVELQRRGTCQPL